MRAITVLVTFAIYLASPNVGHASHQKSHGAHSSSGSASVQEKLRKRWSNDPRYRAHPSGGNLDAADQRYAQLAASGKPWRITSDCGSACTLGFGHFSKDRICISNNVRIGFHEGIYMRNTQRMWRAYPPDVRSLITRRGGMREEWLWIPAREFHKLGYQRC